MSNDRVTVPTYYQDNFELPTKYTSQILARISYMFNLICSTV